MSKSMQQKHLHFILPECLVVFIVQIALEKLDSSASQYYDQEMSGEVIYLIHGCNR